jgi:hypothetical protein
VHLPVLRIISSRRTFSTNYMPEFQVKYNKVHINLKTREDPSISSLRDKSFLKIGRCRLCSQAVAISACFAPALILRRSLIYSLSLFQIMGKSHSPMIYSHPRSTQRRLSKLSEILDYQSWNSRTNQGFKRSTSIISWFGSKIVYLACSKSWWMLTRRSGT